MVDTVASEARKERRRFLNAYKQAMGCKDCGIVSDSLHFDHTRKETKAFMVSWAVSYSWNRLLREVEKCEIRCPSCHRQRHYREDPTPLNQHAKKTHCFRGHPFTDENTFITKKGHRQCRTCRRKYLRTRRLAGFAS